MPGKEALFEPACSKYNYQSMTELVVGTRGSQLALLQARAIVAELAKRAPQVTCTIKIIKTTGDKVTEVPLSQIGDKGLFVKEIELALLDGRIDFAVHSAKDLPSDMDPRLCVAAYPSREEPSDALVSNAGALFELPAGAVVGTSSVRRRAQLLAARPDLNVADLRGNLDTRLRKAESGGYDAIVLACAGLRRIKMESRITQVLPHDVCLPAAGQGAIAVQCRAQDATARSLAVLDDPATRACVEAERALLRCLGAGCQTPVAALAVPDRGGLRLAALVASRDGSRVVRTSGAGTIDDPAALGSRAAEDLMNAGAGELLDQARRDLEPKPTGAA